MTPPRANTPLATRRYLVRTTTKETQHEKTRTAMSRGALSPLTTSTRAHYSPLLQVPPDAPRLRVPVWPLARQGPRTAGYHIRHHLFLFLLATAASSGSLRKTKERRGRGNWWLRQRPRTRQRSTAGKRKGSIRVRRNSCMCHRSRLRATDPLLAAQGPVGRRRGRQKRWWWDVQGG
ncbi:hypothetical protein EDB85DRAFT_1566557 [Lactarius pseudohatsudake]|nr:hypothetical protein EDB85DRAFT_1566557 [Lactarius pseudohatsudake]